MKKKVFMVMPFQNEVANSNYQHSIKPICEGFNLEVRRADEIFSTNPIYDDIVKEIQDASIVIVDITGKNPNVFYELGIAHTLKQNRTIMLTQDSFDGMPFDIAHFRIISYKDSIASRTDFENKLKETLKILLSDLKETFEDEFELTIEILSSSNKVSDLLILLGVNQYEGTIHKNDPLYLEGSYPFGESSNSSISAENGAKSLIKLGYINIENELVNVTEKGKALVELLVEKGFKCNRFNNQKFEKDYIPISDRRLR